MAQHRHRSASLLWVYVFVLLAVSATCASSGVFVPGPPGADEPALTREEMAEFLRTAKIVGSKGTSKGVTRPRRLTLTDGRLTYDALFQAVDEEKSVQRFQGGRVEINFRDSWKYNVAAYRLAELVGLGHMVPVTVERSYDQQRGALTWWIPNVKWDEQSRRADGAEPPDRLDWSHQTHDSRVFTELVYDSDRNMSNQLIDQEWRLWMVDFTRAFRRHTFLRAPNTLVQCRRSLCDRLRTLTREEIAAATGKYLIPAEVASILKRRDLILERFDRLARERGTDAVFY